MAQSELGAHRVSPRGRPHSIPSGRGQREAKADSLAGDGLSEHEVLQEGLSRPGASRGLRPTRNDRGGQDPLRRERRPSPDGTGNRPGRGRRHGAQEHLTVEEFHQLVWRSTPEEELDNWAVKLANLGGWLTYHGWSSEHSESGFPDRWFVRGNRLIAAELKSEGEWPTQEQYLWLAALQLAGIEIYVWHPHDQDDMAEVLR